MGQIHRTLVDGRTVTARANGGIRKRCACTRSQWRRCSHSWHANFSHGGHEHRVSLHKWAKKPADYVMLQGEARTMFRQWTTAIEGGQEKPAKQVKLETVTLDAIAKSYIAEHANHPDRRTGASKEIVRQVNQLCAAEVDVLGTGTSVRLGSLAASAITKAVIEAFRQHRRQVHEAVKAALAAAADNPGADVPAPLREQARRARGSAKAGRVATNRLLTQRQLGNAVPPLITEILGRSIQAQFFGSKPAAKLKLAVPVRRPIPPAEGVTAVPGRFKPPPPERLVETEPRYIPVKRERKAQDRNLMEV